MNILNRTSKLINAARWWRLNGGKLAGDYEAFLTFLKHLDESTRRADGSLTFVSIGTLMRVSVMADMIDIIGQRSPLPPNTDFFSPHELDLMEEYVEALKKGKAMNKIYKYALHGIMTPIFIQMPVDAFVLSVGMQDDAIVLWAAFCSYDEDKKELRNFLVVPTGRKCTHRFKRFIGTVQQPDGLVFHVFEVE